ncbi:F-box/kelch-repeat protein-like protein [Tanacetum coccineum]
MSYNLCEELIIEIFSRLPSKSLVRFRLVSKSLCSYIANPSFIRLHTLRSPQKFLFTHNTVNGCFYTLHSHDQLPLSPDYGYDGITPFEFPLTYWRIVGSCNGILCLLDNENNFILWNPSIRRKQTIHDPIFRIYHRRIATGFGFDPVTNDYKIVMIYGENGSYSSFVYSIKKLRWYVISFPITTPLNYTSPLGCFVNGVLHWLAIEKINGIIGHRYILTFNISTHAYGMIELSPEWPIHETRPFTIINGSLALRSSKDENATIWVRTTEHNDTGSWFVYFQGKLAELGLGRVIQLTSNGDLFLSYFAKGRFQVYNRETNMQSRLVEFNDSSIIGDVEMYVESLELLERGDPYKEDQVKMARKTTLKIIWIFCKSCICQLGSICNYILNRLHFSFER